MKKMTEENVKAALAGESQAHIKYAAFAERAAEEKLPNVARTFRANSYAEEVHAANYVRALGALGTTGQNLEAAVDGETFEIDEMYPAFVAIAQAQGEKAAATHLGRALAAEKVHAGMYQAAREAVSAGRDIEFKPIHVCSVCGFTMEGEAPDRCPVCGAPKSKFAAF
ncbi:MAG TPA: rubrerythrin family protein [Candidatus Aminicenantes bacterium]|nr:rubrerythrin family protein [Candidatus Aminicenantes bacterium]HRY66322.1 rubrerythrin family protein [Candidatus Aminicenantes bacterium]HRZ73231.1 rubrerythrin family protein [Candidatus Aminicenantes bacterium]